MRRIWLIAAVLMGLNSGANAQTSPGFVFKQVPTPTQWNALFASKMDFGPVPSNLITGGLGYTPLNPGNNLSDLTNPAQALINLGISGVSSVTNNLLVNGVLSMGSGTTSPVIQQTSTGPNFDFKVGSSSSQVRFLNSAGSPMVTIGGTGNQITTSVPNLSTEYVSYNVHHTMVSGSGIGPLSPSLPTFWQQGTYTGVNDTGGGSVNYISSTDTVSNNFNGFPTLQLFQIYNTGYDGGRISVLIEAQKNAAAVNGATSGFGYGTLFVWGHYDAGDGGTIGNFHGAFTNFNPDIRCQGDYIVLCTNDEHDIRLFAGAHSEFKVNLILHNAANDGSHASLLDTALMFDAAPQIAPGTGRHLILMTLGNTSGSFALDPTPPSPTAIMKAVIGINSSFPKRQNADFGFDLANVAFSTYAWRTSGFWIDGQGNLKLGPGLFSYDPTNGGILIGSPNVVEVSATVSAGGANYQVNDQIQDANFGLWQVATLTGSAVATLTPLAPGFASTCPSSPAATTGGNGFGLTLTITCATNADVTIGSGSAIATNATSGFLHIPFSAGTPTGTPGNTLPGCEWNTSSHTLNCRDGGSWYHQTFSSGAG